MRIYTNTTAMTAYRSLSKTNDAVSKSMERLSTGLKINSAADDATGMVISEQMGNQIKGFNQAIKNSQQGMSMLRTAEGAMGQQNELLSRIRELVVSSNAGSMTSENKATIQSEIVQLREQFDSVAGDTEYNGQKLLDGSLGQTKEIDSDTAVDHSTLLGVAGTKAEITGAASAGKYTILFDAADSGTVTMTFDDEAGKVSTQEITINKAAGEAYAGSLNFDKFGITIDFNTSDTSSITGDLIIGDSLDGTVKFQVGANAGQDLEVTIGNMKSTAVGADIGKMLSDIDVSSAQTFADSLEAVDGAISDVANTRATLGATINRFEAGINNLTVSKENLEASQSLIKDLDMADEMMQMTRNQVLSQASTAMLAQANQQPQNILQLLR